jgi:Nucleotidyl transferase AbiEii toxin, Type IV TA system
MSSHRPTRATSDGRTYLDLQSLARKTGRSSEDLMRLYALEGLLVRLSASQYATQLVLKGGVLLAAYGTRRATRDVDLQARQLENEADKVLAMVREIAEIRVDDGLDFAADAATAGAIRHGDAYQGVRVELTCALASARLSLHVDVNVGDPVWPAPKPITIPGLLGRDRARATPNLGLRTRAAGHASRCQRGGAHDEACRTHGTPEPRLAS